MLDIHHGLEAYVGRYLNIPDDLLDKTPSFPIPRNKPLRDALNKELPAERHLTLKHKRKADDGISGRISSRINTDRNYMTLDDQGIIYALANAYDVNDCQKMWGPTRDWLRFLQTQIRNGQPVLEPTLNIPDFP
jgi:hypothetical protein